MRIVFLNKYQNKVSRGAETFVLELSKRLSKNHEVDIIANVNYWDLLRKRYDVIIPTNGRWQVIIVRKICWLTGAKMIVSGQSGMGWDDRVNLYSFPNIFVALSSKALNWAKKVNPFVKSVYIPNGVDLKKFSISNLQFSKKKTILAVGAFTKQKRLDLVIKAVGQLSDVKLLLVGANGEEKENLKNLGEKLLSGCFEMKTVPFEKMPEIYHSADVFTLPSASSESFGNVLVEAMASGLPVVATDDEVRREIVGDAGILVNPEDIEAYSKALEEALKKNWGGKPRKQAEKFGWDEIARKYEEILKTLV